MTLFKQIGITSERQSTTGTKLLAVPVAEDKTYCADAGGQSYFTLEKTANPTQPF